ncbi:single-stranded DNA-binding protein [Streptomyces viridodiastaticus]|uniref:single-stranded DNA-binding protein n=1 Tax=Streptomyces albogriseolus TaxID=1887 RepID=UPI002251F35B|nr:single-stranded DNA-binding protein [Streptomyces viridodiastaticus]MCX4571583.1 single-stranded DNA-binding protein [Streptomyces viridodiastaticus]
MAGECVITVVGNVVDDQAELRYTTAGKAVAKFRVASTPRTFDRQTNAWRDGESLFLACSAWGPMGENVASTMEKGMRVIVQGRLKQRSYEDKQGVKRTVMELEVDEIGPALRSATATVTKNSSGQGRQQFEETRRQTSQEARQDPWGSDVPGTAPAAGAWGGGDLPPF